MDKRVLFAASVLGLAVAFCAGANPIVLPSGAYIDEDLYITIVPDGNSLEATVTSQFVLQRCSLVTSILFPVPIGAHDVSVYQVSGTTETPLTWRWNSESLNYTTILPEEPNLPIIQWDGPWGGSSSASFKVVYKHILIDRPTEKVFFYASGVSKLSETTQFFNVDFDVTLPKGYSADLCMDNDVTPFYLDRYAMSFWIYPDRQTFRIYKDTIIHLRPDAARGDCDSDGLPNGEEFLPSVAFSSYPPVGPAKPATTDADNKGDFNADGNIDRISYNWWGNSVTVQFADATGVYTNGQTFPVFCVQHVYAGDIDMDGDIDFAVAGLTHAYSEFPQLTVFQNDGTGSFRVLFRYTGTVTATEWPQVLIASGSSWRLSFYYNSTVKRWKTTVTPSAAVDINGNWVPDSCEGLLAGDLDFNGIRDANDAGAFSARWLEAGCKTPVWCYGADVNRNGAVDFADFALWADAWMTREE